MFSEAAKMSLEASDVQTDEDCEELVEDSFSLSVDNSEKTTRRKRSSGKPPPSARSPYLTSLNVQPRRTAVAAWRITRASLGDTRGELAGESSSARLSSLSNGHDLSQTLRSVCEVTPELLKQTLSMRKHKNLHSAANGFSVTTADHRDKEDMYDEIIHLKKSLHVQKSDNQQMKVKLRRLEEDNAKREKQIEELLDPTKASEYARSLVDKKKEGSVIVNGLKQRILKLEQQCREKENALSKLQSELRTTNLEELKVTVESYFKEIQRLRMLLEAAEKSSRAESKCSQRQQRALSSTVHQLSENLRQLQQENATLREELDTESPAGGIKGYREWSKQRLLRRLLELEKRRGDSRRHAHSALSGPSLDKQVQVAPTDIPGFAIATEAVVSVGTVTEEEEEVSDLRRRLCQLEKEKVELQETLTNKNDEVIQLRTAREGLEKEKEQWKEEQTNERDRERRLHKQELEKLWERIQTLEEDKIKSGQSESASLSANCNDSLSKSDETDTGVIEERDGEQDADLGRDAEKKKSGRRRCKEKEKAARIIQTHWKQHRKRDIVMLQSAIRGHLLRESLLKDSQSKDASATQGDKASSVDNEGDVFALTVIQSAFRGHLARCRALTERSSGLSVPLPVENSLPKKAPRRARSTASRKGVASNQKDDKGQGDKDDPWPVSSTYASRTTTTTKQTPLHCTVESGGSTAVDSDDSDDIIVSPSRPLRCREVLML